MTSSTNPDDDIYNQSFTEMTSISDLKSVTSSSAINSPNNSPIQSSNSESSDSDSDSEPEPESEINTSTSHKRMRIWSKYKRFRDQITGEEVIYELVNPKSSSKGLFTLFNSLVTISSISLLVSSNLFTFTIGVLVGRRIAYEF
jgi:hypothetical protein